MRRTVLLTVVLGSLVVIGGCTGTSSPDATTDVGQEVQESLPGSPSNQPLPNGDDEEVASALRNLATLQEGYLTEHDQYTTSLTKLYKQGVTQGYPSDPFAGTGGSYAGGAVDIQVFVDNKDYKYCMQATSASGTTLHYYSEDGPDFGSCPEF